MVFTVSIRHCLCSIANVFHYIVTLSELFLLDVFDQHGSPLYVCVCLHAHFCKQLNSIFSVGGCVGMPGMGLESLGSLTWHLDVHLMSRVWLCFLISGDWFDHFGDTLKRHFLFISC